MDTTENYGFGGIGWLILILLFFMGFGGAWGGNRPMPNQPDGAQVASTIYSQQAADTSEDNARSILSRGYEAQIATLNNQYQTLLGFKDQQYQMNSCCCDIKTEVLADGQKTRDLINSLVNTDLRAQLVEKTDELATLQQTGALVSALRPYPTPSYIVSSPYSSIYSGIYGGTGYFGY